MAESQSQSQSRTSRSKSKSRSRSRSRSATRDLPAPANDNENDKAEKSGENGNGRESSEKTGRKIKLPVVLWKTWLYRKHHFCCFGCELLTPVILCGVFYALISSVKSKESWYKDERKDEPLVARNSEVIIKKMMDEVFLNPWDRDRSSRHSRNAAPLRFQERFQNLKKNPPTKCDSKTGNLTYVIAYAPKGVTIPDEIMDKVQSFLDTYVKEKDGNASVKCCGFKEEREIEDYFKKWDLDNPKFNFMDRYQDGDKNDDKDKEPEKPKEKFVGAFILDFPKGKGEWSYKLRLIDEYYFSKYDTLQFYPQSSRDAFPDPNKGRPSFPKTMHYENFVGFQVLMDLILLNQLDGGASIPNISLGDLPNPTPANAFSNLISWWYFYGPFLACSITFLITLIQTVRGIASEKETGFKEILKVHGLGHWINLLGWTFSTMFVIPWGATLITLTFGLGFFQYTDRFMFWITMILYGLQIMALAFFIASICTKALFASIIAFVVWFSSALVGALLVSDLSSDRESDFHKEVYVQMGNVGKFFLSVVFPDVALSFAFNVFMGYEKREVASSWSRLYTPFTDWDHSSIGLIWTAMLFSIFFYIVLGTYLENVLPSNYGARKPVLYPFYKSTWCRGNSSTKIEPKEKQKEKSVVQKSGGAFEPDPVGLTPGVSLYELTKVYGKRTVVNGVSLHIYQGQITVLLGHNGAGKSTLVSMATGLITPTKGTAVIQGCDIRKDLDGAQTSMSICPQENMQSSTFSVIEHLRLFALLKGSSFSQSKAQAEEWAQKLKLAEKKTTAANKLSGGMRRRLQLGMSLIGGNHVVFLDEPSSGLDPQTRRDVWDILMNYRGTSTIILSTHYMEEADVLGDRIVIMRGGQFQCCGSPLFLKGIYGIGYTLHVTINRPNSNSNPKSQNQTPTISPIESKSNSQIQTERKGSKKSSKETIKTTTTLARRKSSRKNLTSSKSNPGLSKEENETNVQVLSVVKSHFPNARIVKATAGDNNSSTRQLDINIPQATTKAGASNSNLPAPETSEPTEPGPENAGKTVKLDNASKFPTFFKDLESNSSKLGIAHSSLTFTTLDDVFEKAGAQVYSSEKEGENEGVMKMDELESIQVDRNNLGFKQFRAFLLKKLGITARKWGLLIFQLFFPAFFMCLALVIVSMGYSGHTTPGPNVKININGFENPVVSYTSTSPDLTRHFKSFVGASAQEVKSGSLEQVLKSALKQDTGFYTYHHLLAADLSQKDKNLSVAVFASQMAVHLQPFAINVATNTILKKIRQDGKSNNNEYSFSQLSVSNQALRRNKKLEQDRRRILEASTSNKYYHMKETILYSFGEVFALLLVLAMVPVVVTFIFVPAQEKVTEWKHLQVQMTGASPASYWAAFFIVDFLILVIICVILVALVPIFGAFDAYTPFQAKNGLGVLFLILLTFGYSTLCMGYFASSRAKNVTSTIIFFVCFHLFIIMAHLIVLLLILKMTNEKYFTPNDVIKPSIFFQIFPTDNLLFSLRFFNLQAQRNIACGRLENLLVDQCKKPEFAESELFICCRECKKNNCIEVKPYLEGLEFVDVGRLILVQLAVGTFFLLLLIFKESGVVKKCCKKGASSKKNNENLTVEQNPNSDSKPDEDVIAEIQRVKIQVEEKKRMEDGDSFLVNQLSKAFKNFQAVKNVTFGVRKDQCFGLLGPNGCGKTTMFRMLAGQEFPDTGNAYINLNNEGQEQGQGQSGGGDLNCNLQQNEKQFLSNIGYCPQFDAFSGYLTGKEMLLLMGRLRGIEEKSVSKAADQWLLQMGLEKSAKVQCRKYSGGMKRKLSTALSLIGGPKLVFLDEPSTGVDPHARRQFWKVLASAQKAGQSIVLTSHSMEECEALCSSLCIMINGKMQCLGGVEHLKHKFAIGHDLTIKLTVRIPPRPEMQGNPNTPNLNQNPIQSQGPSASKQNTAAPLSASNSYWQLPQVQELLKLKESIQQGFSPCILKDEHENILQYQIQNTLMPWSTLFQTMEEIKERHKSLIQEYTLQETTLEQVFLSIARMQITREEAKANCCKVCCLALWGEACS